MIISRPLKYRFPAGDIRKELPSHFNEGGAGIPLKDSNGTIVSEARLSELGILVLVEATPSAGKVITKSHGEMIAGKWTEVIDEEKTPEEITTAAALAKTSFNVRDIAFACEAIDASNSEGLETPVTNLADKLDTIMSNTKVMTHLAGAGGTVNLTDPTAMQAMAIFTEAEINAIKQEII